ncbi:hypothetical protein HDU90_007953 [Geranomyces variabilis]|nr:hypothetical protein HDU90_007953 [Geranomyces variabilis]
MSSTGVLKTKRIIWSPHIDKRLFLAGETDLRLYEWSPLNETDSDFAANDPIRLVAVNNNVTHMKCFDWCPNPELSDLVAVGYNTGRTVLTRIQDFRFVNRSSTGSASHNVSGPPSRHASSTSLYQSATPGGAGNSSSSSTLKVLWEHAPRHSRPCNFVAFCPTDTKLLAAGMDKVRSESGLLVWDIEACMRSSLVASSFRSPSSDSLYAGGAGDPTGVSGPMTDALRNMTIADPDAGLEFRKNTVSSQTDANGKVIPAGQSSVSQSTRPMASYGASEGISSGAWLHNTSPQLIAGMGLKWIRGLDLRAPNSAPTLVIATKAVLGIVADPFNAQRFASYADDNIVRIWDARNISEPALAFNAEFRNAIGHLSWSPVRSGCLAAIGKDSPVLKVWDIEETVRRDHVTSALPRNLMTKNGMYAQDAAMLSGEAGIDPNSSAHNGDATGGVPLASGPAELDMTSATSPSHSIENGETVPILWKARLVRPTSLSLQSFAWLPFPVSDDFSHHIVSTSYATEHKFDITRLPVNYKVTFAPKGELAVTGGRSIAVISPQLTAGDGVQGSNANIYITSPVDSTAAAPVAQIWNPKTDISVIMRERALRGYSLNAQKNCTILRADSSELREVWDWTHRLGRTLEGTRMSIDGVDYTGQGINSVVHDMMTTREFHRKLFSSNQRNSPLSPQSPADALLSFPTYSNPHRRLALVMCGWSFHADRPFDGEETLDSALERLQAENEYEKAAGWALFHSSSLSKALECLNHAGDERLNLVATAMAGYTTAARHTPGAEMWENLCRSLSVGLTDPYLRAIFALIASDGNWANVLQEQGLTLKERVGIALRFLDDEQLLRYVSSLTEEMLALGDITGLLLTGYTPAGVDLLQRYINQTGDVQTATLLMSSGSPGRFSDTRLDEWAETYRLLLDRWQLYHVRSRFDIARQRHLAGFAAQTPHPSMLYNANVAPQIYVRCNFCNQPVVNGLAPTSSSSGGGAGAGGGGGQQGVAKKQSGTNVAAQAAVVAAAAAAAAAVGGAGQQGTSNPPGSLVVGPSKVKITSCPSCRKPLPRCALCLLHLGTPVDNLQYFSRRDKPSDEQTGATLTGFDLWFTWCQTCRHGGHAAHMLQWFDGHRECPVADCTCRCGDL